MLYIQLQELDHYYSGVRNNVKLLYKDSNNESLKVELFIYETLLLLLIQNCKDSNNQFLRGFEGARISEIWHPICHNRQY